MRRVRYELTEIPGSLLGFSNVDVTVAVLDEHIECLPALTFGGFTELRVGHQGQELPKVNRPRIIDVDVFDNGFDLIL